MGLDGATDIDGGMIAAAPGRVTQFGAFVSLDPGIEALLHASQISDPAPEDPTLLLHEGQQIQARIISIEPDIPSPDDPDRPRYDP